MAPTTTKSAPASSEPYLKSKNAVYLWTFIGFNLALFLSLFTTKGFTGSSIEDLWARVTTKDGIIAAIIPILAIVLSGAIGDLGKARLVFWRWHNPLPGCRVFTELVSTDPRIDVPALTKKLGEFPKDPQAQNALWYRLYREHKGDIQISEAHRIYLLTRDMATVSILFFVLFSIGMFVGSVNWKTAVLYMFALIAQYLLVACAARNYGTRFVLNILSEQSHSM